MFAIGFLLFTVCVFIGWSNLVDMHSDPNTWPQFFVVLGTFAGAICMVISVTVKAWEVML